MLRLLEGLSLLCGIVGELFEELGEEDGLGKMLLLIPEDVSVCTPPPSLECAGPGSSLLLSLGYMLHFSRMIFTNNFTPIDGILASKKYLANQFT